MRKLLVLVLVVPVIVALLVGLTGCGESAEEIAKKSIKASEKIETLHFTVESVQELPRAPIQDGKVAKKKYTNNSEGDVNQKTGDFKVSTELTEGVPVTALQVDEKIYFQLANVWYEMPESFKLPAPVTQSLSISQYLKYFKTLSKKGDVEIEGEPCFHLQGIPDMKELVKLPGITDLLKNPTTGEQIRTVDELAEAKTSLDFFIQKKDYFIKRSQASIGIRAPDELIKLGYAEPGDRVEVEQQTTLSKFNEKLNLQAPKNAKPWPTPTPQT